MQRRQARNAHEPTTYHPEYANWDAIAPAADDGSAAPPGAAIGICIIIGIGM